MSYFIGDLTIRALPRQELRQRRSHKQLYEVVDPLIYFSDRAGVLVVPSGLITDFASVPSMTRFLINDDDPDLLLGSVVHDFLYQQGGRLPDGRQLTRRQADEILVEAMAAVGAPTIKSATVYAAVRAGGGSSWRS